MLTLHRISRFLKADAKHPRIRRCPRINIVSSNYVAEYEFWRWLEPSRAANLCGLEWEFFGKPWPIGRLSHLESTAPPSQMCLTCHWGVIQFQLCELGTNLHLTLSEAAALAFSRWAISFHP
jgi:hypothetical protein